MTDDQIEHMVNRFLQWKLPENFNPDAGISFKPTFNDEYNARRGNPPQYHKPIGTNLFGASEAGEMVRFMLEGMPASPTPEPVAWRTEYRDVYNGYDTGWRHHYHSTKPHPAPLTSDGCGHRNVTPLYAAPEPSGAVVEALPIVERCARVAEDMILYTGWDVASAIRAIDNEGSEAGSDRLREAKRRLALTQGCLDCNADDEQFWRRVIAFLEEVA